MKRFFLSLAALGVVLAPLSASAQPTSTASGSPSSASNAGPAVTVDDTLSGNALGDDNVAAGDNNAPQVEDSAFADQGGVAVEDDLEGGIADNGSTAIGEDAQIDAFNSGTGNALEDSGLADNGSLAFGENANLDEIGLNNNSPGAFAAGEIDDTVGSSVGFNNRTLSPDLAQGQVFAPNANPGAVTIPGAINLEGLVGLPTTITTFSPSAEAVNIVESSNFNQNSNVNNSSAFSD